MFELGRRVQLCRTSPRSQVLVNPSYQIIVNRESADRPFEFPAGWQVISSGYQATDLVTTATREKKNIPESLWEFNCLLACSFSEFDPSYYGAKHDGLVKSSGK
jgi:hypothetical protein